MQPIQLILVVFLVFAISRVYLRAREGTLSIGEIMFWVGIFTAAVVGVIDTNFLSFIATQLGIGRGADVAVYISIVLLFYLIFRTNVMIENLRHEITQLVRVIALMEAEDKLKQKPKKGK